MTTRLPTDQTSAPGKKASLASAMTDGQQGHPLSGLLRHLAEAVDELPAAAPDATVEPKLAAAHQDLLWTAQILDAWRAAAHLGSAAGPLNLVPLDLQRLARERTDALAGPAALRGTKLVFDAQAVSEVMGEPVVIETLFKALMACALLAGPSPTQFRIAIDESDGSVTWRIGPSDDTAEPAEDSATGPAGPMLGPEQLSQVIELLQPLAKAQGGSLAIEPRGDLAFRLPAVKRHDTPAEGTILIVDDDPDGAFLLEQVLLKAGYHVRIAGNGLEGLSLARQKGIALILLDVMLPGLDGFEVCHRLRDDPATAKTPIVMISAKSRPEDREMGLKLGANAYMTKPLGMNDVVQSVARFMKSTEEGLDD